MTVSTTNTPVFSTRLRDVIDTVAPRGARFDPLGLVSGFRAYRVYTELSGRSDSELTRLGIERTDIPRVAVGLMTTRKA